MSRDFYLNGVTKNKKRLPAVAQQAKAGINEKRSVGVLAFHGDFAEHIAILQGMNVPVREVRLLDELRDLTHLIIPGGESTVISRFLFESGLAAEIQQRVRKGNLAIFGTCAGAILLAKTIQGSHPPRSLELMDMIIERNAYGTQAQSFQSEIHLKGRKKKIPVSFIRAPKIIKVGKDVNVLAVHEKTPVVVRQGRLLAATCHPEVRGDTALHEFFLQT